MHADVIIPNIVHYFNYLNYKQKKNWKDEYQKVNSVLFWNNGYLYFLIYVFLYWADDQHWVPITFIIRSEGYPPQHLEYGSSQGDYLPFGDIIIREVMMLSDFLQYLHFVKHF